MLKRNISTLQTAVQQAYSDAAENPQGEHPFPIGLEFAASLGYPRDLLARLPSVSVSAFAGVSNVSVFADIPKGAAVLDLGCGAGLDSLIAAKRTGASGRVIGVDFSQAMLRRARQGALEFGMDNLEFFQADADNLPVEAGQIDVVLVNGIFNLNPEREAIFGELARVVRPGGAVYAAELILREPLPPEVRRSETNWFAWIAGAKEGGAFLQEFRSAGFRHATLLRTTRNARTKNPAVLAAEVYAQKWLELEISQTFPLDEEGVMTTQVTPDVETLRREVQHKYTEVAAQPDQTFHFHHGRPLAEMLGYPMEQVDDMPTQAVESFAGVGNPLSLGPLHVGETVLDVGSGGGFDCFLAGQSVGPEGKVTGVDMTEAMLEKARDTARQMGLTQVEFRHGFVEELPVPGASVDVVMSNGVINLCPDKYKAFDEIFRVLKPGGRLYLADIVVHKPVPDGAKANVDLWTAWIGGALLEGEYLDAIQQAGFADVELVSTADVFAGADGEGNAHAFGTMGANIRARKPA